MLRSLLLILAAVLLMSPVFLSGQGSDHFDAFFSNFKVAVQQKDTATLDKMMDSKFDFIRATSVPHQTVFEGLDSDNGRQWINLKQAVRGTPELYKGNGPYENSRVLRCTPIRMAFNCVIVFKLDSQNHWRWKAMVMPTW